MLTLQTAAFLVLAGGAVLRVRAAFRNSRARLSWLATVVGALALLTLGSVIPLTVLDGALGGTNLIYLVQNLLAIVAFWLVLEAAIIDEDEHAPRPKWRWWVLALALAGTSLAFLFVDRGATSATFIHDNTRQVAAVLCASLYLAGIIGISAQLILEVRHRRLAAYWPFLAGGTLVILAGVNEIFWLSAAHANAVDARVLAAGYALFDPLFYMGVILIVGGIMSFTGRKWYRDSRVTLAIRQLSRITQRAGLRPRLSSPDDPAGGDPRLTVVYDLLISIHDGSFAGRLQLNSREELIVSQAEALVTRELLRAGRQ